MSTEKDFSQLQKKSVVLVFTYAPFGFGHLRVTDALYHGLPHDIAPILLGATDESLNFFYRFMSIHPITRAIMERTQVGVLENIVTRIYRKVLWSKTKLTYEQLSTIIDERIELPETVVIVATHFGFAHQLAAVKDRLEKEKKIRIYLFVQVTDDSPQHLWYVPNADLIFVPSNKTKEILQSYGKHAGLAHTQIEAIPYPITQRLTQDIASEKYNERLHQLDPKFMETVHIAIPISGAAVGMRYFTDLIDRIGKNPRSILFHVVCKSNSYTLPFLSEFLKRQNLKLDVSTRDKEVIDLYEKVYEEHVISLEVTKPSEQSFKALLDPCQVGGSIILLTSPVGKQEYDNLDFLLRHHMMPELGEQRLLYDHAKLAKPLTIERKQQILQNASHWRAVCLPPNPKDAGTFILWCLQESIFAAMAKYKKYHYDTQRHANELSIHGVETFWQRIQAYMKENALLS